MKQSIRTKSPFQQREKPAILQDKPPFQHIRKPARTRDGQRVTRQDIARLTGLSLGEVYIVDIGGCSARPHFQKVLQAFNKLTGQWLTIDDIRRAGVV